METMAGVAAAAISAGESARVPALGSPGDAADGVEPLALAYATARRFSSFS